MVSQSPAGPSGELEQFIDRFLSAVCDNSRRHILDYLSSLPQRENAPAESSVGEIADHLGLANSTTSEHLKQLLQMNLLLAHKHGKRTFYSLRNHELVQAFRDLMGSLKSHYHHHVLPPD